MLLGAAPLPVTPRGYCCRQTKFSKIGCLEFPQNGMVRSRYGPKSHISISLQDLSGLGENRAQHRLPSRTITASAFGSARIHHPTCQNRQVHKRSGSDNNATSPKPSGKQNTGIEASRSAMTTNIPVRLFLLCGSQFLSKTLDRILSIKAHILIVGTRSYSAGTPVEIFESTCDALLTTLEAAC